MILDGVTAQLGSLAIGGTDEVGVDWEITDMKGWGGPASTNDPQQRDRGIGTYSGDAFPKGLEITIDGEFIAPTPEAGTMAWQRLKAACSLAPTKLTVNEPGMSRWVMARRSDAPIPTWKTGRLCTWSIQMHADDPRLFGDNLTAWTHLPSSSGGLVVPVTAPFTVDAQVVSGQISLTNPGDEIGPVHLRIDGPCRGPIITHVSSGRSLVFASSLQLREGEFITVDMENHTVLAQGQAPRSKWVTRRGWSEFDPGKNTWAFTATGYDQGAQLTVIAMPAWQ